MLEKINNMAKISENMIPDINADWSLDASNNLSYSGEAYKDLLLSSFDAPFNYSAKIENDIRSI